MDYFEFGGVVRRSRVVRAFSDEAAFQVPQNEGKPKAEIQKQFENIEKLQGDISIVPNLFLQ
jgi:hypothetical protein